MHTKLGISSPVEVARMLIAAGARVNDGGLVVARRASVTRIGAQAA